MHFTVCLFVLKYARGYMIVSLASYAEAFPPACFKGVSTLDMQRLGILAPFLIIFLLLDRFCFLCS